MTEEAFFSKTFLERRSVRIYDDRPVPRELRDAVLQAAMRAPTAGNMMLYSIIEVEDGALKQRLSETCDHQPFIAKAPLVLVFLADYARTMDYFDRGGALNSSRESGGLPCEPQEADLLLACCDALVSAQSAASAAESLGLGSCYIGDVMENWELHKSLFALPRWTFPIAMLCIGYATESQRLRPQPERLPQDFVVHKNRYRRLLDDELERMYPEEKRRFNGQNGIHTPAQALYARKFSSDFSVEMRRSVRAMLAEWRGQDVYAP